MDKIIFLIPAFNEEKNLKKVILQFKKYGSIFVINDGSTDKTEEIAKKNSKYHLNIDIKSIPLKNKLIDNENSIVI